jgi:hypothetical protein
MDRYEQFIGLPLQLTFSTTRSSMQDLGHASSINNNNLTNLEVIRVILVS